MTSLNLSRLMAPMNALVGYASASRAPFAEVRACVDAYGSALQGGRPALPTIQNLLNTLDLIPIRPTEAPAVAQAAVAVLRADGLFPFPSQNLDEFLSCLEIETTRTSNPLARHGSRFPGYTTHRSLGRGCFGEVFLGTDALRKEDVALKAYRPPFKQGEEGNAPLRGLFNELRFQAASGLNGVVAALRCGLTLGLEPFLVLEFVSEGTVENRIRRLSEGPLPSFETLSELAKLVLISAHQVHQAGIVHGDMNVSNFLLSQTSIETSREAKLCDFALSRRTSEPPYRFETIGKKNGMSEGLQYDVFQLGKILYQIFALHPNDISDHSVMRAPAPSRRKPELQLPPWMDDLVARCVTPDLSVRYASAGNVLETFLERNVTHCNS